MRTESFLRKVYPEVGAGGYTSLDGSMEFYGRVQALIRENMTVVDFGAGRGAWFEDDPCKARQAARLVKGRVRRVIGCDVDPAVMGNRSIDQGIVIRLGKALAIETASVDMIICDYVFEHITDVGWLASEFDRILKSEGWICARTPTRYCYVALVARLVRNRHHAMFLKRVQPERKEIDVFPTVYQLNTRRQISRVFPNTDYDDFSYLYTAEPAYHFENRMLFRLLQFAHWLMPKWFSGNLFVFMQKK